eukprot:COSAG02_NODE_8682_length_2480_cov_4.675346_2_plen_80_part_01
MKDAAPRWTATACVGCFVFVVPSLRGGVCACPFAELLKVGQQNRALDVLHEVLKSRRHRNWQIALEKIVKKYLELCVEMK